MATTNSSGVLSDMMALKGLDLRQNQDGDAFAVLHQSGCRRVIQIDSPEFRKHVTDQIVSRNRLAPTPRQVQTFIETLQSKSRTRNKSITTFTRVGKVGGAHYIDLCDGTGQAIKVKKEGWNIVKKPKAYFVRSGNMRPLPTPRRGGKISDLLRITNLHPDDLIIVLAWIMECYRVGTPFVGLLLFGRQGSAKSSTQDVLCRLIDPTSSDRQTRTANVRDLVAVSESSFLIRMENLEGLSAGMQSFLCTMLTGGRHVERRLNTNSDAHSVDITGPVILNGISPVVTSPDLLDRFICLELPSIDPKSRISEEQLKCDVDRTIELVFGAVLDCFSKVVGKIPALRQEERAYPRMKDFALLGEATARALGKAPGWFVKDYERRLRNNSEYSISSSPLGSAILSYFERGETTLTGTFAEIRDKLFGTLSVDLSRHASWPKTGKAFSDECRRLQPALEQNGIGSKLGPRRKDGVPWNFYKLSECAA